MVLALLVLTGQLKPKQLIEKLRDASSSLGCFAQAFDSRAIAGELHLKAALENARKSFELGENVSQTLENEFLLKAAGTKKFDAAVRRIGLKDSAHALVFCESEKALEAIAKKLNAKAKKFSPMLTLKNAQKIFEIEDELLKTLSLEQAVIEKTALFSG